MVALGVVAVAVALIFILDPEPLSTLEVQDKLHGAKRK